jgi:hypothetical protein
VSVIQDGNGLLDEKELHICLLLLYDKLNDKLPCHVRPPSSEQVHDLFVRHTAGNASACLDQDQFLELASSLLACEKRWWDTVFVRVVVTVGLQLALFPLVGASFASDRPNFSIYQLLGALFKII